jgi:hypothetical protein
MYMDGSVVHSFVVEGPITALRFGSYGREVSLVGPAKLSNTDTKTDAGTIVCSMSPHILVHLMSRRTRWWLCTARAVPSRSRS